MFIEYNLEWEGEVIYANKGKVGAPYHLCIGRPYVDGLSRVLLPTDSRSLVHDLNITASLPLLIV